MRNAESSIRNMEDSNVCSVSAQFPMSDKYPQCLHKFLMSHMSVNVPNFGQFLFAVKSRISSNIFKNKKKIVKTKL